MRRIVTEIALLVSVVVFTLTLPSFFVPVKAIENWVSDLFEVFASPVEPQNSDVVVLTLTEDTLAQFPYRSPVDRGFLANLLRQIDRAGARAVGFDVLFDQPTEPAKDAALAAALREVKLPVVVARGDADSGLTEEQSAFLAEFAKPVRMGWANLRKDDADGTVRELQPPERGWSSLPGAVAEAVGGTVPKVPVPIVYRRGPDAATPAIPAYPAHLAGALPPEWLKGKAILVGSDLPQEDRHRTPFAAAYGNTEGTIPGVFIHAFALAQMIDGRARPSWTPLEAGALTVAMAGTGLRIAALSLPMLATGALAVVALAIPWAGGLELAKFGGPVAAPLSPSLALILALWLGSALFGRRQLSEKRFIESAFQRYVSPAVLAEIQADPSKLRLGGDRRELTFVFSDIAGFTTLSEQLPPDRVASLLNEYLDGMSKTVLDHQGTIDKFIGDAVVALFGAPVAHEDDPDRAVSCALAMDAFAASFRITHAALGFGLTRIGVNSGQAVVGNFGGSARFDYTAIGDTVNTAARLEGVNKYLGTRLAVGGETVARCTRHRFIPVAEVVLKGKHIPIPVSMPVAEGADEALIAAWRTAHELVRLADPTAVEALTALAARWPDAALPRLYLPRLAKGETGTVLVMAEK